MSKQARASAAETVSHPGLPESPCQGPGRSDRPLVGNLEPRTRLGPALAAQAPAGCRWAAPRAGVGYAPGAEHGTSAESTDLLSLWIRCSSPGGAGYLHARGFRLPSGRIMRRAGPGPGARTMAYGERHET